MIWESLLRPTRVVMTSRTLMEGGALQLVVCFRGLCICQICLQLSICLHIPERLAHARSRHKLSQGWMPAYARYAGTNKICRHMLHLSINWRKAGVSFPR